MTEPHSLSELFDRASDGIEPPGLAGAALAGARRRRARRRGVGAALVSSVAVVAVVVATQVGGGTQVAPPVGPGTPTPTASPAPVEKVWPEWDPREADDLPTAPASVAPALPDVIEPPATSPPLSESPVVTAVLVVRTDDATIQLLGTDGAWRSVALPGRYYFGNLSPGGTRLLVDGSSAAEQTILYDLATGVGRELLPPAGYPKVGDSSWQWVDEQTLRLEDRLVDAVTGAVRPSPYVGAVTLDPDGEIVELGEGFGATASVIDWAGGVRREVPSADLGRLAYLVAGRTTLAGMSGYDATVVDRRTLAPLASLPLSDPGGTYSNGGLFTVALCDDGTVLLSVALFGRDGRGSRIVAWDPDSGELSLVSSDPEANGVDFADELVRVSEPADASSAAAGPPDEVPTPVIDVEPEPRWDPATVADLPFRNLLLPLDLTPGPDCCTDFLRTLAVVGREDALWLLDDGERWQRLDYPAADTSDATAISADGTRVATVGDGGLWWRPSAGGDWTRLDLPRGFQIPFDDFSVQLDFVGTDLLLLQQGTHSWVVDSDGATLLPFDQLDVVVPAADGVLALRFADTAHRSVDLWRDGEVTTLADPSLLGATQSLASDGRSMVTTVATGVAGSSALLALDLASAKVRAYLPVRDPGNRYTDGGGLHPVGWLDDDTALIEVLGVGARAATTWLVTWDVRTGDLARVASYPSDQRVAYASDALDDGS